MDLAENKRRGFNINQMKMSNQNNAVESTSSAQLVTPEEAKEVASMKDAFHVDTGLIPQAALDDQASELQALGLSVFNQDVFEQGIMDQVDQALAHEEEIRLRNILQKELKTINDDILLSKNDLDRVNRAETSLENQGSQSREIQRQLESIRKQKENKLRQLKTLKVRRENVTRKLKAFDKTTEDTQISEQGSSTFDQAFQIGTKRESERELLIRTGVMTPFGTVVQTSSQKPVTKPSHVSGFEKMLMAKESSSRKVQKDFKKYLKRKSARGFLPSSSRDGSREQLSVEQDTSQDLADARTEKKESLSKLGRRAKNKIYNEKHWSRDDDDDEDVASVDDDDGDDYKPTQDVESSDDYSDLTEEEEGRDENLCGASKRKRRHSRNSARRKKPRPPPKYREAVGEDEPTRTKVKRDLSIRQEKDDADPEAYQRRLFKQQKIDRQEAEREAEKMGDEDLEDEFEFDGDFSVPSKLWKKLFKYQKTGVRWLWELHCQQAGGIIGDEMGLGKTIQTISFLAALRTSQVKNVNFPYKGLGPTIIICPTTVMHQWLKEFHKWWPDFRVAILHSSSSFTGSESDLVRSIAKSQGILITSYNTLVIHQELVLRFNWHYVILDEGHKIRNPDAKVTLCCKQFRTPHRIILSGSPIQNNLKELWSLFDFVFPGKLGTLPDFMQHFSIPIVQGGYSNATQIQVETAYRCACILRDTINPYLIRRMKADVKKSLDLPNKSEQVLFCRLTDEQRDVYQEYLDSRECNAILQGKFQVFSGLITLRKICNHPDLSTGGPHLFSQDAPTDPEDQFGYHKRSGKMIVVEALLRLWHKQKHKVLLFTQSKSMLNILEKFAHDQGYTYLTMDGGTSIMARQPLIAQYNNDPSIYLFLLTTRVGGLGVNLTGADRVIIYDPDWNPSTDVQARERAWRIGQTRQVTIYRLLTSGTIEEKIYHRQIFKQFLTNRVLKDPKQRRLFKSQDMLELFTLGSQDNKEGTETSALFAGTGSDVKMPRRHRRNRFDEIQERKEREKKEVEEEERGNDSRFEEDQDMGLEDEEFERMKELARSLSRKMEIEKRSRESGSTETGQQKLTNKGQSSSQRNSCEKTTEQSLSENEEVHQIAKTEGSSEGKTLVSNRDDEEMWVNVKVEQPDEWVQPTSSEMSVPKSSNTENSTGSSDVAKKGHNWQHNGKIWTIPKNTNRETQRSREKPSRENTNFETEISTSTWTVDDQESDNKRQSRSNHRRDDGKNKKHKKKKKRHDARFEGERIPHLVKHMPLSQPGPGTSTDEQQTKPQISHTEQPDSNKHQDDYVLRQLFKKTGIQGAMKHDKIMESGRPDYAIVEAEAEKVAREAAAALKRSRQMCSSALSGVPTWTGQHGRTSKPRFGQKKNTLLVCKPNKSESSSSPQVASSSQVQNNSNKEKSKLFDGSMSGNVSLASKNDTMTSGDLLSRIRARKRISTIQVPEDDFLRPDPPSSLDPKDEELLQDIRNYVAFMGNTNGEASTQEIVLNFGKRLPKSDAPKFKAMLNQICDFHSGVWKLKSEFR